MSRRSEAQRAIDEGTSIFDVPRDLIEVTVTGLVRDEGSVVLFSGITNDDDSREITFAVDHRAAQGCVDALAEGDVTAYVEAWQIVGAR